MILSGDLDSSAWGTVRAYVRQGKQEEAVAVVLGTLRCSRRDAEDTVADAVSLEQAALGRSSG